MNSNPHEKSNQKNSEFIPNFTQYPNEILDNWMPHLSGNQTKILNCFVRYIYGFHKQYDKISIRQIASKTGITTSKVFKDVKNLIQIGCIKIIKKGDKANPHTYQIINITDVLPTRKHKVKNTNIDIDDIGVTPEVTGCCPRDNTGVTLEVTEVLPQREQQKKEINIKESVKEREAIEQFGKTEQLPKNLAHTPEIQIPKQFSKEEHELARMLGFNIDDALQPEDPKQLAINTRQEEINTHYSNEIAKVEQELNLQSDIMIPKLTIESLLEASEDFLGRVGIGFDNNPRRILNLIYNQLPKDFVIKEDSKDVEILGDMIKKYMSSGKDERDSIAKRIYQAVEAMLKIYVIKKYGDPYREQMYPEIIKANLTLYLNCNPTFKYCLGGFSNDIDGVYSEVCRLAAKDFKKKVSEIKIEHDKKLRQLQANRLADMQAMFTEEEKLGFQARTNAIMDKMDNKPDISDEPLAKPIKANLTPEESLEMNRLFMVKDPSQEDLDRLNYLFKKSKK
jgi:DNA-binding Lrp family transcriptional regulator